jgi:diaminopimelate decarboxylase
MDHFDYRDGELYVEDIPLSQIAEQVGTPFYCYSTATLERHFKVFADAVAPLGGEVCYAVKANSNIAVIATLAKMGAGADVVSGGELRRALAAGVAPAKIVFSGVGKTPEELGEALRVGVKQINVESEPELRSLSDVATALGIEAAVAVRVNPDVDAGTHEKITTGKSENKFGIDLELARGVYQRAASLPGIKLVGVALHIGSQLTDLEPYRLAYGRAVEFVRQLREDGHDIQHLDLGGGLGITYDQEVAPTPEAYGKMVGEVIGDLDINVTFEPGRMISGNSGVLVTRVIFVKEGINRKFCIIDGAMNDLIRPTLYEAFHAIVPAKEPEDGFEPVEMDIVGPICESGDYFAKGRSFPPVEDGDLLVVRTAGAYASVMSSMYNSRALAPEVLVNGKDYAVVRKRVDVEDMLRFESFPDWIDPQATEKTETG